MTSSSIIRVCNIELPIPQTGDESQKTVFFSVTWHSTSNFFCYRFLYSLTKILVRYIIFEGQQW